MKYALADKHSIRAVISEENRIYSSTTLKTGWYRMSIPLLPIRYRAPTKTELTQFTKRCEEIGRRLVKIFPGLKGNMDMHYHVGASMYLSLRIKTNVLA